MTSSSTTTTCCTPIWSAASASSPMAAWGHHRRDPARAQDRPAIFDDDQHEDGSPGAVERLLPLVDAFIADVDRDRRIVVVTPPDGIPEDPR